MSARIRIGISGWTYPPWRGVFYPPGLVHRRELAYAAEAFSTIEINGSFYSLQRPSSYARWAEETPDDFVFAVKGGRFITHMKKLRDVEVPLATSLASGVLGLGAKLGPFLWQLPPMLPYDRGRMDAFFALLPRTTGDAAHLAGGYDPAILERLGEEPVVATDDPARPLRHAVEVRHDSYATDDFVELCRAHGVAIVVADTAGRWPLLTEVTADHVYIRLHGDEELYTSGYSDAALAMWADRVVGWARTEGVAAVNVYFDNDAKAYAPRDARRLKQIVDANCG